jgi:hypothetical protein
MAVKIGTPDADKQASLTHLAGVIDDCVHPTFHAALKAFIFYPFQ